MPRREGAAGTRQSIGGKQREAKRLFEEDIIQLPAGSSLYLTTDGFADQNSPQAERIGSYNLKLFLNTVLNKNMEDTIIPESIKEAYDLALKRRSKIDNAEILISSKVKAEEVDESGETVEVETEDVIFSGFATVIPIRAKESSLDYYLMVLSEEVVA